jgi:uncharacterized protein YjdB
MGWRMPFFIRERASRIASASVFLFFASVCSAFLLAGCGGSAGTHPDQPTGTPASPGTPAKTLAGITVGPTTSEITVGATQQYTATGTFSDNSTANITSSVTWSSSSSAAATVNSAGLATGVSAGTSTITASFSGVTGSATLTVTGSQTPPTLQTIAVTPATANVTVGGTQQLTATATYSDKSTKNVTSTVSWASSAPAVATVSAGGLITAVAAGTTTVTASMNGISSQSTVTVATAAPTVTSISVTPPTASVAVGATQQFTAIATYSDKSTKDVTSSASWTSAAPSTATVNDTGLATGVAAGSTSVTASFGGASGTAEINVTSSSTKTITSIAVTPASPSFDVGSTQQFTATATYSDGSNANVSSTATWASSNTSVATINSSGLATGVASGSTTISATLNSVAGSTSATITAVSATGVNITTWHVDTNRSGLNSSETTLTPANVNSQSFGKLFSVVVDGYVYGEPLIMSNVTIKGAKHNVLYVATENDSVYAFDANTGGTPLWHVSLLKPGETAISGGAITPVQGVTSTPVIDPATGTLYVVSTQAASANNGTFRLNALDITTGAQKFGGPMTINASVPGTSPAGNGSTVSLSTNCVQRAALLLANGNIYMGFGGCATGWLLAYNASTLAQVAVWNASPNLPPEGGAYASAGGVWMGSGGPVADSSGNIYVTTGNGPWDGQTAWSDSILKFSPTLKIEDYFTPDAYAYMGCKDADLAAGGLMLIPGTSQLIAGGKTGKLYLVNSGNMGHEQANDSGATQTLWFESDLSTPYSETCTLNGTTYSTDINPYEIFGTSAYYNGYVFLGITPTATTTVAPVREFEYSGTMTPGAYTSPSIQENTRGTTPFISSNGDHNGILWMIDEGQPIQNGVNNPTNAILRAYDADEFPNELYNSSQNSADAAGYGIKFTSPVVANGKVYISTGHNLWSTSNPNPQGEIDVYGLH